MPTPFHSLLAKSYLSKNNRIYSFCGLLISKIRNKQENKQIKYVGRGRLVREYIGEMSVRGQQRKESRGKEMGWGGGDGGRGGGGEGRCEEGGGRWEVGCEEGGGKGGCEKGGGEGGCEKGGGE